MTVPVGITPRGVTHLTTSLRARLEEFYADEWVVGEVVSFKYHTGTSMYYFTLIEGRDRIECTLRAGQFRRRFDIRDGMSVIVRCDVTFYAPQGKCQLRITDIYPKGLGAEELALQELKSKLAMKGYFSEERKRAITPFPRVIALVTSSTSAAIRDMLEISGKRYPYCRIVIRHCTVQGDKAPGEIAESLKLLNHLHSRGQLPLDAIVLGRGGGASKDLSAFDAEMVADAIYASRVPVVSAVGHETDLTIADRVADMRAETPSAAMTRILPDQYALRQQFDMKINLLTQQVRKRLQRVASKVDAIETRQVFRKPLERFERMQQQLDQLRARLVRATQNHQETLKQQVGALAEQLEALSPLKVLARGYSLTQRADGLVVRDVAEVTVGEELTTRLSRGQLRVRVEGIEQPG
jgi:exodeoxyribonuclease VII large subunit